MEEILRRYYPVEMKLDSSSGKPKIVGHAATFNSLSEDFGGYREVIRPGAFQEALINSDPVALVNHDPNLVLGRKSSGTLRLWEDERGLAYEITPPDTSYARDLLEVMKRGDIKQSSFAFTLAEYGWISYSAPCEQPKNNFYRVQKKIKVERIF